MTGMPACLLYTADAAIRRSVSAYLAAAGPVWAASRADELLDACRRMAPLPVLIDLLAPGAAAALARIRQEFAECPAIALAVPDSEPAREAAQAGAWNVRDRAGLNADLERVVAVAARHCAVIRENRLLRRGADTRAPAHARRDGEEDAAAPFGPPLDGFVRALRHADNPDIMLDHLFDAVAAAARVARVGVFTGARGADVYRLRAGVRCLEDTAGLTFPESDELVLWLRRHAHLVRRGTVGADDGPADAVLLERALDLFGAEVIVPLLGRRRLIGWMFLGRRITGAAFSDANLEDLARLADHVGTALENALLFEEATLQRTLAETLLQSVPLGIVSCDAEGTVRRFSGAAEELLGLRASAVVGQPAGELGSRPADLLLRAVRGEPREAEDTLGAPPRRRVLALAARPIGDPAARLGAVLTVRDLTGERELRERQERVERAAFWTELAAALSHELKNPLVSISTLAQLLPERYNDAEFREHFSQTVRDDVQRIDAVVGQINAFANPPPLEFGQISIGAVIEDAVKQAKERAPVNGTVVEVAAERDLPAVRGDRRALVDCISHLVTNSLEALEGVSAPRVSVRAGRAAEADRPAVVVSVRDNGKGIPLDISDKVFSIFCTKKARGFGLGLPIVKRTVTDHGGEVSIETGSAGTNVAVVLPLPRGGEEKA